jgi:hypothetical protein
VRAVNLLQALDDPNLFAGHFKGASWAAWRAFLAALFGHRPKNASAEFRRPGEDLDKNIARQRPAQLVANFLMSAVRRSVAPSDYCLAIGKLAPQLIVETRGFFAEHN